MSRADSRRVAPLGLTVGLALVTVLPGLLVWVGDAGADASTLSPGQLPAGTFSMSAVWDGESAYIFGGYTNTYSNQIVRYHPGTNTVTTMAATLPSSRMSTSAVWAGSHAYIFGGIDGPWGLTSAAILRYDPRNDTMTTMNATLPTARRDTSAVWDGTYAYVFGGNGHDGTLSNQIVRYDPATDTATTMLGKLPFPRDRTSAVWDGSRAYVFGGAGASALALEIVRYDPATDRVTLASASFPENGVISSSAAFDGSHAYVFGGCNFGAACPTNEIVRYDPTTDSLVTMSARLPTGRSHTSAVWNGADFFIFGGASRSGHLRDIVRYDLAPGAPRDLRAAPGPLPAEVTLTWAAPPSNSYSSPLANYNVFRRTGSGLDTPIGTVPASQLTFTDSWLPDTSWAPTDSFFYRVTVENAAGKSPSSNQVSCSPVRSLVVTFTCP